MLFTLTNVITSPILRSIPNSVTIILKVSFTVGVSFCCCACTGIKEEEEEEELTVADSISRDVKVRKIIILLVLFRKVVAVVTIVIVIIKSPKIT
jgi:hypothetical protein